MLISFICFPGREIMGPRQGLLLPLCSEITLWWWYMVTETEPGLVATQYKSLTPHHPHPLPGASPIVLLAPSFTLFVSEIPYLELSCPWKCCALNCAATNNAEAIANNWLLSVSVNWCPKREQLITYRLVSTSTKWRHVHQWFPKPLPTPASSQAEKRPSSATNLKRRQKAAELSQIGCPGRRLGPSRNGVRQIPFSAWRHSSLCHTQHAPT